MKVTSILPDNLILEVQQLTHGKNLTQSLLIALKDWLAIQKIKSLNKKITRKPLKFKRNFSAESIRALNRK